MTSNDVTNDDKTQGDMMRGSKVAKPVTGCGLSMQVVDGDIRGQRISVLRDGKINIVLVKRSLVKNEGLTVLYSETAEKCLEEPSYDLVLGSIPGIRQVDDPHLEWWVAYETEQNTWSCRLLENSPSKKLKK